MDTILFNGKIITGNIEQPSAEALAVSSGMIALVGDNEQVTAAGNSNTDLIDLEGRVVLPGFNDSHLHLLGYAGVSFLLLCLEKAGVADQEGYLRKSEDSMLCV